MGLNLQANYGQTPLDEEEKEGLKIKTIATKEELDEFEQKNIEEAITWTLRKKWTVDKILSESFICELHQRMYGSVWVWAGHFRSSAKNIGVDAYQIPTALRQLLDDGKYWIAQATFSPEETVIRFKHRLVTIHCFPNGNGRHSRLMADILLEKIYQLPVFSWGAYSNEKADEVRRAYLTAIKEADKGAIEPLLAFART